jgi:hypothetical protein
MRREYKGFYIEPAGGGTGRSSNGYALYHVVTGNLAGHATSIREAKIEIDSIHNDVNDYARCAGCNPVDLRYKRGRFVYDLRNASARRLSGGRE